MGRQGLLSRFRGCWLCRRSQQDTARRALWVTEDYWYLLRLPFVSFLTLSKIFDILGLSIGYVRSKWLDRHVYTENLKVQKNSPIGDGSDATDQPGLKDMTLKAIQILREQAKKNDTGYFLMYVSDYILR